MSLKGYEEIIWAQNMLYSVEYRIKWGKISD